METDSLDQKQSAGSALHCHFSTTMSNDSFKILLVPEIPALLAYESGVSSAAPTKINVKKYIFIGARINFPLSSPLQIHKAKKKKKTASERTK